MRFSVLALLVTYAAAVWGVDPRPVAEPEAGVGAEEAPGPTTDVRPTPGEPAATFTPSEKISADSAVSFPVDI